MDHDALDRALEQNNVLLQAVSLDLKQLVIVADNQSQEVLYANHLASIQLSVDRTFARQLIHSVQSGKKRAGNGCAIEFAHHGAEQKSYYMVTTYPYLWVRRPATAYLLRDVSAERAQSREEKARGDEDQLTKLRNRLSGMMTLNKWLDSGRSFALCLADLDNLRYINQTYGREEGDSYIIQVANHLRSAFSKDDVVVRAGGDEFMILALEMGQEEMEGLLEDVCEQLRCIAADKPYYYNISYGMILVPPGRSISASTLLSKADQRMHEAKLINKRKRLLTEENVFG